MISQLNNLAIEVDGRYASDSELEFLGDYVQSFNLRLQTYQHIQELEKTLVQDALVKMRSLDPSVLTKDGADASAKCKQDVVAVLRYTSLAVLLNDPDGLQEQLLFWLQTIMRALRKEQVCNLTQTVLQEVMKQHLTPPQASLVVPMLELNRRMLSATV
jgi:Phycobilisome protein